MAVNGRAITDAQAHLWKAESPDWPWVPGRKPQLPEPFTIERLLALMDEGGVDRVVIVPPSWPGDRNDYALEAAKRYPNRFAVMGRLPIEKREQAAALLPKWKEQPGMVGVRLTFQAAMEKLLTEGHARAILSVPAHDERRALARKVVAQGLSVRATERAARWAGAQTKPRKARRVDPALADRARTALEAMTGADVKVTDTRIEIPFADEVALAELVESLEARN